MKPKKKKLEEYDDFPAGYNQCVDDYEAWLPSEEEIEKIIMKTMNNLYIDIPSNSNKNMSWSDFTENLAEIIRKRLE